MSINIRIHNFIYAYYYIYVYYRGPPNTLSIHGRSIVFVDYNGPGCGEPFSIK